MNVTQARFERSFSPFSFANRVGMGTLPALDRVSALCAEYPWALRLDVQQHFPSIDHDILLQALFRRVPEPGLREVMRLIVASAPQADEPPPLLPGDDLLAACRPRGLPIGNLTSQCWNNAYLDPLDQFITRTLGCSAYARYVDDMVLCAHGKAELAQWQLAVRGFAGSRLRLRLHARSAQAQPTRAGIPWLGFVVFPTHRRLKSRKVVAATRRLTQAWRAWQCGETGFDARVQGWVAHARHGSTWQVRETVLGRFDITRPAAP